MFSLKGKPQTLRVSKNLAKDFAEMEAAPHDRPLSERRLQVYERMFREGLFRPVTWAKAFCHETKGWYRVNGKHTSILLSEWKDKLPEFYVVIEEYECDTLEDVARLYATFDSKMQSRSASDIYNSFAAIMPELSVIRARSIVVIVSGMAYHTWQGMSTSKQPAERAELLLDNAPFALWANELFTGGLHEESRQSSLHIKRAPVMAAAFGTWNKAKGPSTEFWQAVRDETDPHPNLPTRTLARFLHLAGTKVGNKGGSIKKSSEREIYVKCLNAWNNWREDSELPIKYLKYHADAKVPAIR